MIRTTTLCVACGLLLGALAAVADDVPDLDPTWIEFVAPNSNSRVLLVRPDGQGPGFTEARGLDGAIVDSRIKITVMTGTGERVYNYPREDIWLMDLDGDLALCEGGTIPDDDTNEQGEAFWVNPPRVGGHSDSPVTAYVNGDAVITGTGLPLFFNSPDVDGNLEVGLSDLDDFVSDYFGPYQLRADLHYDNMISLTDLDVFVEAYFDGIACP